jgi:hypothetical protein
MQFFEHVGGAETYLFRSLDNVSPAFGGSTVRLKLGFARAS